MMRTALCRIFWAPLRCFHSTLSHRTGRNATYNAKSINNHNHDHNERSLEWRRMRSERSAQVVSLLMQTGGGTVMQNTNAKSIKRLKIPRSRTLRLTLWHSSFFFNSTTQFQRLSIKMMVRGVWRSTIITILMAESQVQLSASSFHSFMSTAHTIIYLALWTLVSVNHSME